LKDCDVLVVGAGPTGLVLALWLTKLGAKVRIVDRTDAPGTTSRALAIQARTLELYRQLGLADAVVERAHKTPAVNLWARGKREARISFEEIGAAFTPYPYLRIFPQDEHEKLLVDRLAGMGVEVERRTELVGFSDGGDRVVARLGRAERGEEACEAAFVGGCDGAGSSCARSSVSGFPAEPMSRFSTSPTSRPKGRRSTGNCTSFSTKRIFSRFSLSRGRAARAWSERCGANALSALTRSGSRT
jgi:2-polyprenyl-6-methoxyphenol hydroxylase-like FAD-dependent oxidoreductase